MNETTALPGDGQIADRLSAYLTAQTGAPVAITGLRRFPVGFSWATFGLTASLPDGDRDLILRMGPDTGLFAPYLARPQYLVQKVLSPTDIKVPDAYWYSDDPAVMGMPFYVSEKAVGDAPIPFVSNGAEFETGYRDSLARDFVDQLAAIHRFDWKASPLAEWDTGQTVENVAAREIDFWEQLHDRWATRPYPMVYCTLTWLRANLPVAPRVAIVHGDYRIGNFLEVDGRITAILDWELAHLGDPHEDIGWAFLPQYSGGSGLVCRLISRQDFIARYQDKTGITVDPATLKFYIVLNLFKIAMTQLAGVSCFESGDFDDMRMPAMGTQIFAAFRQIQKAIEEDA